MRIDAVLVDSILSWIGALGVACLLVHILRSRTRMFLELRTCFLLYCIGLLLFLRGFSWLFPARWLDLLTVVPATLLPLAAHVFVESLLRRHLPLAMKAFVATGSLVFLIADCLGQLYDREAWIRSFLGFELVTFALLLVFLVRRDRQSLSVAENRVIDTLLLAVLAALPLIAADYRMVLGFPSVRLGPLAALVFVYVFVRISERMQRGAILARDLPRIAVSTLVLALVMFALTGGDTASLLACAALALSFVLLFATWNHLWVLREQSRDRSFLHWLAAAETVSLSAFLASLQNCPAAEEHVVLRDVDLKGYDVPALAQRLASGSRVVGRAQLDRGAASRSAAEVELDEQLSALLQRWGMSHVCLASLEPPVLLLLNQAQIADVPLAELETALIHKLARLSPTDAYLSA